MSKKKQQQQFKNNIVACAQKKMRPTHLAVLYMNGTCDFSRCCFCYYKESGRQLLLKYNSNAKRSKLLEMLKKPFHNQAKFYD